MAVDTCSVREEAGHLCCHGNRLVVQNTTKDGIYYKML